MKFSGAFLTALVVGALCLFSECSSSSRVGSNTEDVVISFSQTDTSMNKAIEVARASINQFNNALKNKPEAEMLSLKVHFDTPDGGGEHMWLSNIRLTDKGYFGVVANEAEFTQKVKLGDSLYINNNEISDWMYVEDGKLRGGYTIRVMRNNLKTEEEKQQFDNDLGFIIE